MNMTVAPAIIARILLRVGSGFLMAKGWLAPDVGPEIANDVDIQALIEFGVGVAMWGAAEGWFYIAKKLGWAH